VAGYVPGISKLQEENKPEKRRPEKRRPKNTAHTKTIYQKAKMTPKLYHFRLIVLDIFA